MDLLSDALQPYKEIVGTVAGIVAVGQMFSGSFMCYDIYKKGTTGNMGIMPFLGGFIMGILNLKFGFILRDNTMILVSLIGTAVSTVYLMIYYQYAANKGDAWAKLGLGGAFSGILVGYTEYEDPNLVEYRYGLIITAFMFWMIAAPLFSLPDIIRKKSTDGLPFPLILSGSVVTFMWLLYGIILKNNFLVIQNLVVFFLCVGQLSLFVIYPSTPAEQQPVKAKKSD